MVARKNGEARESMASAINDEIIFIITSLVPKVRWRHVSRQQFLAKTATDGWQSNNKEKAKKKLKKEMWEEESTANAIAGVLMKVSWLVNELQPAAEYQISAANNDDYENQIGLNYTRQSRIYAWIEFCN